MGSGGSSDKERSLGESSGRDSDGRSNKEMASSDLLKGRLGCSETASSLKDMEVLLELSISAKQSGNERRENMCMDGPLSGPLVEVMIKAQEVKKVAIVDQNISLVTTEFGSVSGQTEKARCNTSRQPELSRQTLSLGLADVKVPLIKGKKWKRIVREIKGTPTAAGIWSSLTPHWLIAGNTLNYIVIEPIRSCKSHYFRWRASSSSGVSVTKYNRDGFFIDKRGELRNFNHKKLSRKRCGSLRGKGWKYGSGFVDGIFPVLSPIAQQILKFVQHQVDFNIICDSFDTLPPTHTTWDDLINVAVQLRLNKQWDPIVLICHWILNRSSFRADVICFNLLIDVYGQKSLYKKAESTYLELVEARCIPTEDTYALLIKAYCKCGLLEKAEAVFTEMRKYGLPPSAIVYNAYIDGLMKGGNTQKAVEIFQRMKRDSCQPSTETYTLMINLYGKASKSYMAFKLFNEMKTHKCKPNICTYTALVNAFAREGLCEKAEEIFEKLQHAGHEPDVYAYNALMEAYSRAGYPYGAAEIFSLMQHMGCEPDRASYNIMVDAYGRAGLHEDAQAAFEEMKRLGITPTMKSHMLLLCAYSKSGNVAKCEDILNQMHKSGLKPDTFVLNSMLNLYGRLGQFDKMEEVLTAMQKGSYGADISTYNILINVYGRAGFFERMEELFRSLAAKRLTPDVVTWTSRLAAYSRKKLYTRCLEIFEEMIDAACYPDGGTAKVLLSACSSEDQIEEVTTLIRTMHKDVRTDLPI
ncbi:hypothetical protein LWI29_014861 [Acer saccharum]|uniref:Pentacotripeptide-repeat region of PRORP domain-containing protein n=1 Tax=Acer saccharum TaxID=4024 RepID=A0AA39RR90_ACESA|nr:hypothetical protein LWI29_014861 [Acer saccharum]